MGFYDYDSWLTDDGSGDLEMRECARCGGEVFQEGRDYDGPVFPECSECQEVVCEACMDSEVDACKVCAPALHEEEEPERPTTFDALAAMSRIVARGGGA